MTDNVYLAECSTEEFQCSKDIDIAIELAYEDGEMISQRELHLFMEEVGFEKEDIYDTLYHARHIHKSEKTQDYWQDYYFSY